jgi:hypothetical protein
MEKKDAGSGIPQIPSLKYIGGSQGLRDGRFAVIGEGFQLKNYLSSVNYFPKRSIFGIQRLLAHYI